MHEFVRSTNGFNYTFEKKLLANETIILKMPPVSPNKRGINDIGWQSDGEPMLYGTLSRHPMSDGAIWQRIYPEDEINKTISALKIVNGSEPCNIIIKAIFC